MKFVLVGAGGHAKVLAEVISASGDEIAVYVDTKAAAWLGVRRVTGDADVDPGVGPIVLGIGGVAPDELARRLSLYTAYRKRGFASRPIFHATAWVSQTAKVGNGSVVLAGAVIQPGVAVGDAVIVNTGAIVEHDSTVGDGTHVAPGAIVLGNCRVGRCCMIGAGAVILPGAEVPDNTLVAACTRWAGVSPIAGRSQ